VGVGSVDPLHGEPQALKVPVAGDVNAFEVTEQRGTGVPGRVRRRVHDVVAVEGAQRDELHVFDVQTRQEALEGLANFVEAGLGPADQVHLVDGDHQVRNAQQRCDVGVTAGLFDDSQTGIHQHDGEVGGGGTGHHVAGVLHVAGGIGDDELATRGGEVAVGDVDGDALFAFGAQAIGEIGQVDLAATGDVGGTF